MSADSSTREIRIGVVLIPTDPWVESVSVARRLDNLGYHHLWVYDHLTWRRYRDQPWHGIYPWLTGIAALTGRIRVGTVVANPNIRHPVVLAKDAMTIDHISDGRLILGVGAGGVGYDATAFGQPDLTLKERSQRFEEYIEVLGGLLEGSITNHQGPWYTVNEARMNPGCVQSPRVPVAVAARGPKSIRLAARSGDAWITNGDTTLEDVSVGRHRSIVRDQVDLFDQACVDVGRDPADVERYLLVSEGDGRPLRSMEAFDDAVGFYRELGFTDLIFTYPRPDDPVWNDPPEMVEAIADRYIPGGPSAP